MLKGVVARARARRRGWTSRSRWLSELHGTALLLAASVARAGQERRLQFLLTAARRLRISASRRLLRRAIEPHLHGQATEFWRHRRIGWARHEEQVGGLGQAALTTSLLLKEPGRNGEKGVLYSSFEYNWMRIVANYDARRLFDEYLLVGASSWSPPDYSAFANLAGLSKDPAFIGISNRADMESYRLFEPVIRAVPLMACDWINPDLYHPRPHGEREIDILMVANWLPFKRHWLLFEALKRMDRGLRVVLIGRNGPGRTEDDIRREAKLFGVPQDLELLTNIKVEDVTAYQCNARIATLLSDREGSCVAVTECMFADTPVAMMQDAHVGAKAHINRETGVLMRRGTVHLALEGLLEKAGSMTPRRWAIGNITCQKSSILLNDMLRDYCLSAGQPWTRDIVPLQWRYVPAYLSSEDEAAMQSGVARLRAEHGVELARFSYKP